MTQQVSPRSIKCQSRPWSQRRTKANGSHHGDNPLLRPTGIQIAIKPLPAPTNREHRKLIGVKTMSLDTKYSFCCRECCQYFRIWITSYRKDCLMCCPSSKVIKSDTERFLAFGGLHEDTLCDTLQRILPITVQTVHQTSLLYIKSNLDRLELLSPTHGQRSQQQSGQITLQSVLANKPKFLKVTHHAEIWRIELPRSMVVKALSW